METYDIDYSEATFNGHAGTHIRTLSDVSANTISSFKYIEHIVIPEGITSVVSCYGVPFIVVVPKSVTTITEFFGDFYGLNAE